MSTVDDSDSDGQITERGKLERDKIGKTIFKKRRLEMENFFGGYRSFIKNENKKKLETPYSFDIRNEMFRVLQHELDQTLTHAQKEHLAKQWKSYLPAPVILLGDVDQLNDIRSYLNSRDIARVSIDQEKQIVDLRMSEASIPSYMNEPQDNASSVNFTQSYRSICTSDMGTVEGPQPARLSRIPHKTSLENDLDELFQMGTFEDSMDNSDISSGVRSTVEDNYHMITDRIQKKGDVLVLIDSIKRDKGFDWFRNVVNYCNRDKEPILFLLAMNTDQYETVLEILRRDDLLNLRQHNSIKMSIFSFLLMNDLDVLFRFLMYLEKVATSAEIKSICTQDHYFRKALQQMKRGLPCNSELSHATLAKVANICFNQ